MSEPLITKYRPINFDEVIGNELCIQKLKETLKTDSRPHSYLFTGPSGIGKTTLARILGKEFDAFIQEIDAASHSGVENTREIVESSKFKSIMNESSKLLIIDEAHNLSAKAWEPLLKLLEDPPSYFYIVLCSTELAKIPQTIKNRCYHVPLKPLKSREIENLLADVCEIEKWEVNGDVFNAIIPASGGSARLALSILQAGHSCTSREELATIIAEVESENSPVIKLCQYLIKGGKDWPQISRMLEQIEDPDEGIAHACNYLAKAMTRSEERQADQIWRIIQCLSENRAIWDKRIQLYAGIGKYLFGAEPF
jgi:DNA polymerase III gamma/tau subunit